MSHRVRHSPIRRSLSALVLALAGLALHSPSPAADLDFYKDIYPFLKANCISCHNKTTTKADLDMETPERMKKGGESGPAVVPGKSAESLVVLASLHQNDMEMPPANNKSGAVNLTSKEVEMLKAWIDQGAPDSVQQERQVAWQPLAPGVHPIYSVAMTPDGRYAACARSNQIAIYDLATRQFVTQIVDAQEQPGNAHRALVQSLAFSPDGTRLASGSFREVKIWRLEPGTPRATTAMTPPVPANDALIQKISASGKISVLSHALSADGKRVVTGCADGSVRVWDAATGALVITLRGSVAATRKMAALEWTIAAQGLELAFQKTEVAKMEAQNKALDELLKKANDAIVTMKKVLPEKQKAIKPATDAKAEAQKAVDAVAAQLAQAPAGKPDPALEKQLKDAQEALATATTAEAAALAAVSATESNVKDAEDEVKRITGSKAQNAKALTTATALIASAQKLQDQATADLAAAKLAVAQAKAKPLAVAFSNDSQRAAAMFDDATLIVWAVASGIPIEQAGGTAASKTTLTTAPDGTFVASQSMTLTTPAAPHWVLERTLGNAKDSGWFADRVNAVCFSPDGKTLATGGGEPSRSGDIVLFDVASGKPVATWKDRHDDAVLSLNFSPDGKTLASGAADKLAKVTEVATGKQRQLFEGHTHHVMGIAFRSDGRVLATAGADGVVIAWDLLLGERKKKIEGWTKEVTSLQFIGATNQIVTSAGDNLIRVVNDDGTEIRAIAKLPDFMQSAASTPNGSTLIGGGEDSILRVWDGTNGKEVAVFGIK